METCSVVKTFEFVDEILWCDHSNETSSAVLLHCTICFAIFYEVGFHDDTNDLNTAFQCNHCDAKQLAKKTNSG